ncbi:MAG: hypothetical protein JO081_00650 [Alphaproteobacteria bacterium]|nr:hypothetical protein [Alphaproteobacteria bacterium]
MNSVIAQAMPFLQMVWRQKWFAVAAAWLVCTVGWIGVALMPTKYESAARVYLDVDPLLTPLLHGLAADTDPSRHLDFLTRTLLSRPNLEQLAHLTDLDAGITGQSQKEQLLKRLASSIAIGSSGPNLMEISFRDKSPETAKNVVQSLLTVFSEKAAGSSRAEMDSAQRFLDEEIAAYRDQLRAKEQQRVDMAKLYPDLISIAGPDTTGPAGVTRSRLDQARDLVGSTKNELRDAITQRDSLKKELASVPPILTVDGAPQVIINGGKAQSPDEQRLAQMQANLDQLRLKYTDQHPDVIATRAEIKEFQAEMKHSAGGSGGPLKSQIPNAVYDQLKVRLADANGQVATAQHRLADAEAFLERVEKIAQSAPTVLLQIQDLERDNAILQRNYDELVSRRQATNIADAADTKTEKIQFRIIDPPQVPLVPAEPNRPVLVSLVLLAGLGAGVAAPILLGQLDRSFATIAQLRDLGLPILGSVTRISLGVARRRAAMQLAGVCASTVMLIAVYGTLLLLSLNLHSMGIS